MIQKLNQRKQYAKHCLIIGRTNTRGFDNCFENGDGDEVVNYLMETALVSDEEVRQSELPEGWISPDDPKWKKRKRVLKRLSLKAGIKKAGLWDRWLYFYENQTYDGYIKGE